MHISIDQKDVGKFEKGKSVLRFKVSEGLHKIKVFPKVNLYQPNLETN